MSRKTGPGPWGTLMYVCASVVALLLIRHKETPFELQVLAIVVSGIFGVTGHAITRRRSRRVQANRNELAASIRSRALEGGSPPPFFLYLRPFDTTARLTQPVAYPSSENFRFWAGAAELEQRLANALEPCAPLIGLAGPGAALGAGRAGAADAEWQQVINALLMHCRTVFLVPGVSAGTMWEIETIRARPDFLDRTVFIMPTASDDFPVQQHWEDATRALKTLGMTLPPYKREGLLFTLNADGEVDRQAPLGALREWESHGALDRFLDSSPAGDAEPEAPATGLPEGSQPGSPAEGTSSRRESRGGSSAAGAELLASGSPPVRRTRRAFALVGILCVATLLLAGWWRVATRVERATWALDFGEIDEQRNGLSVLVDNVDNDEAFLAIVDWVIRHAHGDLSPEMVPEISRGFARRMPPIDVRAGFVDAVTLLQIRGRHPETRRWIHDYKNEPAVTSALFSHLEKLTQPEYQQWPGAQDRLARELAARPRTAVSVDLALQRWLTTRAPEVLAFLQTFEPSLVKSRVRAAAATPDDGEDEYRLMACQVERCSGADVPPIIRAARSEATRLLSGSAADQSANGEEDSLEVLADGPEKAWRRVSDIGARLGAHRRALVSIGEAAAGTVLSLYYEPSRAMWSFAVLTLAELDRPTLVSQLQADLKRDTRSAAKAVLSLQALPEGERLAHDPLLDALSSRDSRIAGFALASVRQRLKGQALVDGLLLHVADREEFSEDDVALYETALKESGPKAGADVARTMNRLLDSAGGPEHLPWIQKAIAIDVLRDVGTAAELPVLARLRKDPGSYVTIKSEVDPETEKTKEVEREVSFTDASDAAAAAIRRRQ